MSERRDEMLTEVQAQAGLDYLRELQSQANYWGAMAVPNITPRLEAGEDLTDIMGDVLDEGARWLTQASRGKSPIPPGSDLRLSLLELFEATGQDRTRYGYAASR